MSADLPAWENDESIETTWGELIELRYGKGLKGYKGAVGEYPVYGTNGPVGFCDKPLCDFPSVIIGRKGAYRGVHYSDKPFYVIDTAYFVVPKYDINLKWVYYSLLTKDINGLDSGSAIPSTRREDFYAMTAKVPSRIEQDKIVENLDCLNSKIELNRKTNQTLKQIAQAIFKSWFVDFEPVKAKAIVKQKGGDSLAQSLAAQACICGAISLEQLQNLQHDYPKLEDQLHPLITQRFPDEFGMDYWSPETLQTTADLFPNALVESELGEVPVGWEAKPFGEMLSKTIGGDWGKEERDEKHTEKVKILRGTDLPNVYAGNDGKVPTRFVEQKKLATRKLEPGDIVIEVSGGSPTQPTGRSLYLTEEIISRLDADLEPASFCRLFRPVDIEIGLMLGLHLQKIYEDGKTWQYQNQSTGISNFQTKVFLEKELVVVPARDAQSGFYQLVMPYLKKMSSAENKSLVLLRDSLLPKLLSGEIGMVEEVA